MYKIAVVGDVTIDLLKKMDNTIRLTKDYEKDNWELYFSNSVELKGGALLLAEMIEKSIEEEEIIFKFENDFDVYKYNKENIDENFKDYLHTIITLNKFKSVSDEENCPNSKKKYRINYFDGFNFPIDKEDSKEKFKIELVKEEKDKDKEETIKWVKPKNKELDMVLIHDHGNYFRNIEPELLENKIMNYAKDDAYIIYKMRFPLADGKLWKEIQNKIKHNQKLIVIITADDLRENGLRISRSLSWERTAFDLRNNIETIRKTETENKNLKNLKKLFNLNNLNLIIRFETDGAILYQNKIKINENTAKKNNIYTYTLFFDPEVFEGSIDRKYPGNMKSLGIAFVAGLVLGIQKYPKDPEYSNLFEEGIKDGIKKGLIASRKLYETGFKVENPGDKCEKKKKMNYPYKDMFSNIDNKTDDIHDVKIEKTNNEEEFKDWKIINQKLTEDEDKIYQAACQIVKLGKSRSLKAPVAKFGKLVTADKGEMESYHSIKNLINEYLNKKNINVPLSIAVFGPPGSGKSFGVTQIAKSISDDIKKLGFNLSQFQSPNDLFNAFHCIQSTSLKGKTPLVFFDEFDSKLNNENFGWLKYFLSPMNDGSFKQGDTIHPIGKCIFVFAGGTKKTFEEFDADKTKAKGSDFVSRLRGFVNIVGINRSNEEPYQNKSTLTHMEELRSAEKRNIKEDNLYMIRRAMVLRNVLEKNFPNIFEESNGKKIAQIDNSVLNALIKVPNYKHGNRSLEAIIEMSILSNRRRFDRSALPSSEQLQLHVDADIFKGYLNNPIDCQEQIISGKVLESTWKVYSGIVEKIYDKFPELEIHYMLTGSRCPESSENYDNHRGKESWDESINWLEKGGKAYSTNKDYASFCYGIACHHIIDALSAPHCADDDVKIEDHREFEKQAEEQLEKLESLAEETKPSYNDYNKLIAKCNANWKKWMDCKDQEKSQCDIVKENLKDIILATQNAIEESIKKILEQNELK